jgi:hypothetical protein
VTRLSGGGGNPRINPISAAVNVFDCATITISFSQSKLLQQILIVAPQTPEVPPQCATITISFSQSKLLQLLHSD